MSISKIATLEMSNEYPEAKIYVTREGCEKELLAKHRSFETEKLFFNWIDSVKEKEFNVLKSSTVSYAVKPQKGFS